MPAPPDPAVLVVRLVAAVGHSIMAILYVVRWLPVKEPPYMRWFVPMAIGLFAVSALWFWLWVAIDYLRLRRGSRHDR